MNLTPQQDNKALFSIEGGSKVTVQYNPDKLQLDRATSWKEAENQGKNSKLEFQKMTPAALSMELIFDTTVSGEDVRQAYVNKLADAMIPKIEFTTEPSQKEAAKAAKGKPIKKERPPLVTFVWGKLKFVGVIKSLKTSYIMFSDKGTPIRAKVALAMQEFELPRKMDIGGAATPGYNIPKIKLVQIQQGQSLSMLAGSLGTTTQLLADLNGIDDPMNVAAGTMLMAPLA